MLFFSDSKDSDSWLHTRNAIEYAIEYAFSDICEVKRALSVCVKVDSYAICLTP